ncbi:MAG: hypothetical protein QME81_00085 [bacterium]|nr:hypothetical protein [bacterium]
MQPEELWMNSLLFTWKILTVFIRVMVNLSFDTSTTILCEGLFSIEYIRLTGLIGLKSSQGNYVFAEAIIDTGAYISVIPARIAGKIQKKVVGEDKLKGMNPKEECALPVEVGKTTCLLFDEEYNFYS